MNFNSLFFPVPAQPRSCLTHFRETFYLPKVTTGSVAKIATSPAELQHAEYIPCLHISHRRRSQPDCKPTATEESTPPKGESTEKVDCGKMVVFFHGNAEDTHTCYELLLRLSLKLKCAALAVEYPGYGLYK